MVPSKSSNTSIVRPGMFFITTFSLSWLIWVPLDLSHFGIAFNIPESISSIVRLLGVLMPATSALILTRLMGGRDATSGLWTRLVLWRVKGKWWLAAVAGQPALLVLAAFISNLISDSKVTPEPLVSEDAFVVNVIMLLIATLGEEIGWRGAALPSLQQKYSALKSSIILGLLWGVWHIPFWLLLDSFDQYGIGYLGLNLLFVVPLTFYITWFFNHSHQSLLLPVMLHLTFNIVNTILLPVTLNINAFLIFGVLEWIVMFFISPYLEAGQSKELQPVKQF